VQLKVKTYHKRVVETPTNAEDRSTEDDEVGV
jgi:hypothetical protein